MKNRPTTLFPINTVGVEESLPLRSIVIRSGGILFAILLIFEFYTQVS